MRFIIDDKIPFIKGILEPFGKVDYLKGTEICRGDLEHANGLIIRTRTKVNRNLLEGTAISFVGTATIGTDHIDTRWCDMNGITWTSAPGCNSGSVMQYVAASLAYLQGEYNIDPGNTTIGIIGVGNVGTKVARMATALGYKILLNDPPRSRIEGDMGFTDLDQLIRESDIVSLHVPLIKEGQDRTEHLVDSNFLDRLKKGSFIINTSRGPVVREKDLSLSIRSNQIKSAIIDVWETEPGLNIELLNMVDIGTPHIAGYSLDGKAMGTKMVVNRLSEFFDLPLKDWSPPDIPPPANPIIETGRRGTFCREEISKIILSTYPICDDSNLLKRYPDKFEEQRGSYRKRREFQAYTLSVENSESKSILSQLGFNIENLTTLQI